MGQYRLGLDLGTNSIGWCLLNLNEKGQPQGILDMGVRIFSDGRIPNKKKNTSLAVGRRLARQARRRRDRLIQRKKRLMNHLVHHGFMPQDITARKALEKLDPYALRARALDERLTLHELGRAFFQINQRRGFKSNRKSQGGEDGVVKQGVKALERRLKESNARTVGEYLYKRHRKGKSTRARRQGDNGPYPFYPHREGTRQELEAIIQCQRAHHPEVPDSAWQDIQRIILLQRPLQPVKPGNCSLDHQDKRAPRAHRLNQEFRILQELSNLRILRPGQDERPLTREERDCSFAALKKEKKRSFVQLRKLLKLEPHDRFNLQSQQRTNLLGDQTASSLASEECFGKRWWELDEAAQDEIIDRLLNDEDEEALIERLQSEFELHEDAAQAVSDLSLPSGYGRLGHNALSAIVPLMKEECLDYAAAADAAGYHHSDHRPQEQLKRLPYYGQLLTRYVVPSHKGVKEKDLNRPEIRYGRIANPTVHIGLNQLRRLINALIKTYGAPYEIVVELARDLKTNAAQKKQIEKAQKKNKDRNERARQLLEELGLQDNRENRLRYRLWEQLSKNPLERCCPYTGRPIAKSILFSEQIERDHILPFSRTLDDGISNQVLCFAGANRDKGNQSPYEAFGQSPKGYDWAAIQTHAKQMPVAVSRRFASDAMKRYENENNDWLARQLNDTAYLSRVARLYLSYVCDPNRVRVSPGRLTALLRGKWGLSSILSVDGRKSRHDHRHHAIDALVIACTDRGLLQRVSTASAQTLRARLIDEMPVPWANFHAQAKASVEKVVVSHRRDHGLEGALHNDTAYGIVEKLPNDKGYKVVSRKALAKLTNPQVAQIADPHLRAQVQACIDGLSGEKRAAALAAFSAEHGVRRVRVHDTLSNPVLLKNKAGEVYKAYKPDGNAYTAIYRLPNGKYKAECVTRFAAATKAMSPLCISHPDAVLVAQLFNNDVIQCQGELFRIQQMTSGNLILAPLHEANVDARNREKSDPFSYLNRSPVKLFEKMKAQRARVDILGRVWIDT